MKSEVHVKTDSIKLYLSVGLFLTITIITLALIFRFEFGIILLSLAGVALLVGGVAVWSRVGDVRHNRQLRQLDLEVARQRLRLIVAEADKAEFAAMFVSIPRTENIIMLPQANVRVIPAMGDGQGAMVTAAAQLPAGPLELLPLLDRAERVLVKGASDAGKTTLIQHVAGRSQNVIIVDPHYQPGVWPDNCRVVGGGRNFGEIAGFLDWLLLEMDSRYQRRAQGESAFTPYTVVIDEFMSVAAECDRAGTILSAMIRESRKVGFRLFVCSHSELVKPLGLEGAGDVREGLLIIRLYYSQLRQERRATVDAGEGEQPCYIPPFTSGVAGGTAPDITIAPDPEAVKFEEWTRLVREGTTKSAATWQIYDREFSGRFAQELNRRSSSTSGE